MRGADGNGFRPAEFGSELVGDNADVEELEEISFKGMDVVKVDTAELDDIMARLRDNEKVRINKLTPESAKDFQKVLSYVSLLYNTSQYNIIYDIAEKHFGDVKSATPGTVGGYFAGCIVETSFSDSIPGCAVACAGGLPRPKDDEKWKFCDQAVIWGLYEGGKYNFTTILDKEDKEHSILHLNCTNYKTCPGFADEDKKHLKDMGVKRVTLYGYRNSGKDHTPLNEEPVEVDDLRSVDEVGTTDNSSISLVIVVLLVLVAIFFAWRYFSQDPAMSFGF